MGEPIGMIYNIQRFSLDDGPGIRTTVFLKGCNLRCAWCHNPESMQAKPEIMFFRQKCVGCNACVAACPVSAQQPAPDRGLNRLRCVGCGRCVAVCPYGALALRGRRITPVEVLEEAMKDQVFYAASGGGVTFSGGEPLLQPAFLAETLKLCRENGLTTAVDTAGNVPWTSFESILHYTNLVLFDLKAANSTLHKQLTGVENEQILENLVRVSQSDCALRIRVPLIKGMNLNSPEDKRWKEMLDILCGLERVDQVDLLPYHRLGESKYAALDKPCLTNETQRFSDEELNALLQQARRRGLQAYCQALKP